MKPTVVFDTGVILQAVISTGGPAAQLLRLFDEADLLLYVSTELLEEIEEVLRRPSVRNKNPHYSDQDIENLIERLVTRGNLIPTLTSHFTLERDREDDHIINLALEAGVEYLISRDKDLLDLMNDAEFRSRYPHLKILDPVAFLSRG